MHGSEVEAKSKLRLRRACGYDYSCLKALRASQSMGTKPSRPGQAIVRGAVCARLAATRGRTYGAARWGQRRPAHHTPCCLLRGLES